MNALNTKFKSVRMNWDSITFPLLQGTPIGADGTIQDDEDAIGLVMTSLTERPIMPNIDILVAGDIDAREIVYNAPTGLSDEAKNALSNIWIYGADGSNGRTYGSGGGVETVDIYFWVGSSDNVDVPGEGMQKTAFPYQPGMTWGDAIGYINPVVGYGYGTMYQFLTKSGTSVYVTYTSWGGVDSSMLYTGSNSDECVGVKTTDAIDPAKTYFFYSVLDPECLKAGSMILTPGGEKDVFEINVGDEVLSLDPETLEIVTATVETVKRDAMNPRQQTTDHWYRYTFDDGSEIHLVGKHRFWNVEQNAFVWLKDFKPGEHTYKMDGSTPAYVGMETVEEETKWNTFWNVGRANYFVDGFLSGNITSPVPVFPGK